MQDANTHACVQCDLLIKMPQNIEHRFKAVCPRCAHVITVGHLRARQVIAALSLTAIMVLVIACAFPFISFFANGQVRTIGLLQAIGELYLQGDYFVSLLVGMFILVCPLLYLLFLLTVIAGTVLSFSPATKARLVKVIIYVLPWSMAEVFLAGVLVALIKVIALADVTLEVSFWAYVVFAPLFTYIVTLADAHRLWMWVKLESTSK
ncbi:paraquat-inducible protein A [Glaciecola sp. KUL10]|uniref:paraquat-inducible protein A n=1 Tax=Glaciecola sp. (strain KUL10) TaxID=2161813 RepID=UPI000D7871EA|nr:paraquat-inducible protein A [Glaciecola sp. KUL10]GBL03775.1 hypothetical protein KUL10_10750 [Glaciecola sp. KUL10]